MENPSQQPSADLQPLLESHQPAVPPSIPPFILHKSKVPFFILAIFIFLISNS
ncbi:MAG: hypothetical protein Q7K55_04355 [Candidatus Levybacteria bacterium]|nr:hypothetical protein [Candidatus Levybacteria bacterium]